MNLRTHLRSLATLLCALGASAQAAEAQVRPFTGFYLGAESAQESIVGSGRVEGIDILAEDMRRVVGIAAGVRRQLSSGLVVGIEGTVATTDGAMALDNTSPAVSLEYETDRQNTIGGIVGYSPNIRPALLLFAYGSTVTRAFDVRVTRGTASARQDTTFKMRRYGVGLEARVAGQLHLRFRVGSRSADFDSAQADFMPGEKLEYGLAVFYQFTS